MGWREGGYRLCDVVDYDCAVCVAVVHWCEGFVSLLACCVPYLEFDRCAFIESNCLCEKCRSNLSMNINFVPPKQLGKKVQWIHDNHQTGFLQIATLMNSTPSQPSTP